MNCKWKQMLQVNFWLFADACLGATHLVGVTSLQWNKLWTTLLISKAWFCLGLPRLYHNRINWSSFKKSHPSLNLTPAVLLGIVSVAEEINCVRLLSNTWKKNDFGGGNTILNSYANLAANSLPVLLLLWDDDLKIALWSLYEAFSLSCVNFRSAFRITVDFIQKNVTYPSLRCYRVKTVPLINFDDQEVWFVLRMHSRYYFI